MLDLQADTRCGTTTIKSHPVSVPGIVRLDQSGNVNGRLWVLSPTGFEAMGALSNRLWLLSTVVTGRGMSGRKLCPVTRILMLGSFEKIPPTRSRRIGTTGKCSVLLQFKWAERSAAHSADRS